MVPIYEQIVDAVKTQIRKGELKEDENLPSVRMLAKDLKISALTVKKAYDTLENEGFTLPTLEVDCKYKHHVTSGDIIVIEPYISEFNGIRMTVNYNVTNKKKGDIVIDAFTKHCFTDRTLRPINMKKKNIEIYNIFENLYEENAN